MDRYPFNIDRMQNEKSITDIHNFAKKILYEINYLEKLDFPQEDKNLIKKFVEHLKAKDLGNGRIYTYITILIQIRKNLKCNFKEADRTKIEQHDS